MEMMKEYIGKGWEQLLRSNNLGDFDSIWNLEAGWFEEPNERRGGWSGVSRIELKTEDGQSVGMFLKRQENHNTKTITSPIKGIPTFAREFKNIIRFINNDIPTVEPVYFCYRFSNGNYQAILMTKELEGFDSLDADDYLRDGAIMQDKVQREKIMTSVANAMRKMHDSHLRHSCFYSKHVFIRQSGENWDVKFIDLEKMHWELFKYYARFGDLYTFPRRISGWGRKDRVRFFQIYTQEKKLSAKSKLLWRKIDSRMKVKGVEL